MQRITLADVARRAGVGKATASRALRGHADVAPATARAVAAAAAALGYRPDPLLAAMGSYRWPHGRRSRPALIAHLQDAWTAMHGDCRRALTARAEQLGYGLVHRLIGPQAEGAALWSELRSAGVIGAVVDLHAGTPPLELPSDGLAGVVMGESQPHLEWTRITTDWTRLALLATECLRRRGHRRIGHVVRRFACPELTRELVTAALACHQEEDRAELVRVVPGGLASARREVAAWWARCRPTAVVADAPSLAGAFEGGRAVPGRCAFATLIGGGTMVAGREVSGFALDLAYRAERSVEALHGILVHGRGRAHLPPRILLPAPWIEGATGTPRVLRR